MFCTSPDYDYKDDDDDDDEVDPCSKPCSLEVSPVCANGNRAFYNRCAMEVQECREGSNFEYWVRGKCPDRDRDRDSSSKDRDSSPSPSSSSSSSVACPVKLGCSKVVRPVCASNGVTYANLCVLRQLSCRYDLSLKVVGEGTCAAGGGGGGPGSGGGGGPGGGANCPTDSCSREVAPVCGNDGRTYGNK